VVFRILHLKATKQLVTKLLMYLDQPLQPVIIATKIVAIMQVVLVTDYYWDLTKYQTLMMYYYYLLTKPMLSIPITTTMLLLQPIHDTTHPNQLKITVITIIKITIINYPIPVTFRFTTII
jgi:hypothetical protein